MEVVLVLFLERERASAWSARGGLCFDAAHTMTAVCEERPCRDHACERDAADDEACERTLVVREAVSTNC